MHCLVLLPLNLRPRLLSLLPVQLQRLVAGSADGPAVMQLLDELMAVAAERCTEAMLLEASVMDRILVGAGSMRQQQQQQVSLL